MRALHQNPTVVPLAFYRRRAPRRSTQHIGKILTEPTAAPHYCLITETSKGGVRVRIYTGLNFEAPSVFTLHFDGITAKYEVVWRDGQFIGAELISS